jgi:polyisoprenyl-teichoic acid--peptidoglycan teichoic acid transferase
VPALQQGPDEAAASRRPSRPEPAENGRPGEAPGPPQEDHQDGATHRGRHATGDATGTPAFGRVVGWTLLGSLLPGSGLLAAGRNRSGRALLALTALILATLAVGAVLVDPVAVGRRWLSDPNRFVVAAAVLAALVMAWALLVVLTHVALRRSAARDGGRLSRAQSLLGCALVTAIVVAAAVPTAFVGIDALAARDALTAVFSGGGQITGGQVPQARRQDPWAAVQRVNVLLMGSDAGKDRSGIRPDTMVLASINVHTGDTVLISLPRNLQRVPFPPGSPGAARFPNGFQCINPKTGVNTDCLLNGLWVWGEGHPQDYPGDSHPGLTATIQGVQQLTGLTVDQYVMVNLAGFQQLVDIMGGLTVTVRERLPVGGSVEHPVASSWLEPGRQKLNGYFTLWYARSRWSTTDFDRMRRQRCVIGDFVDQIDPVTVALKFSQVAATLKQNLQTSIPLQDLEAWVTLAERVKRSHVRSLTFTDQVIDTVRPDVEKMHELVDQALTPRATETSTSPAAGAGAAPGSSGPSRSVAASPSASPQQAQDVADVC